MQTMNLENMLKDSCNLIKNKDENKVSDSFLPTLPQQLQTAKLYSSNKLITPIQVVAPFKKISLTNISEESSFLIDDKVNLMTSKRKNSVRKKLTNVLSGAMIHFIQFLD